MPVPVASLDRGNTRTGRVPQKLVPVGEHRPVVVETAISISDFTWLMASILVPFCRRFTRGRGRASGGTEVGPRIYRIPTHVFSIRTHYPQYSLR